MRASCVLIESGSASTEAVIHVDAIIFAVGVLRVDTISSVQDVNRLVPINNLVELRWYAGCRFFERFGCWYRDDFGASFR